MNIQIYPPSRELTDEEIKVCNCADCGKLLLGANVFVLVHTHGRNLPEEYRDMKYVEGRIRQRPYCGKCLKANSHDYNS